MTRADLDKKPAEVAAMFDALAGRYDLMNDILSMGQVRLWRRRVQRILQAGPGDRVLDLAAGTGTSSVVFARSGADVVACDFSLGMLQAGQARLLKKDPFQDKTRGRVSFAAGDALHLPFKDGAFQLAIEAQAPLLPVALNGTRACRPKGSLWFGWAKASVRILEPIPTKGLTLEQLPELKERAREAITQALSRGVGGGTAPQVSPAQQPQESV